MRQPFFRLIVLLPLLVSFGSLVAQRSLFDTIRLSKIRLFQNIGPETGIFIDILHEINLVNKVAPASFTANPRLHEQKAGSLVCYKALNLVALFALRRLSFSKIPVSGLG